LSGVLIRIVGVLLMLTALAVPLVRAPDRAVETLVARWAPPPSDFVDVKGQVVHLRDEGPRADPLPVVLLHGTSASLHTWEGWVKAIKGKRRVITLDLPAFGLTGPFSGRYAGQPYGGDEYARFVLDVLDALQVPRFVIGGNSLGGEIAWRVATLARERVDRLVLVDATGPAFEPGNIPIGWRIARVPVLNRLLEEMLPRPLVAQGVVAVYGHPERVSSELIDRYFELTLREGNRRALVQRLAVWKPGADADRIGTLTLPTLILWGGRDQLVPPAVGQTFAKAIAGSQLVVFDDLGHVPHEEDPVRTVQPVLAFLGLN
jgi:pimeloyl-ACP methyl ester carboxylesterase